MEIVQLAPRRPTEDDLKALQRSLMAARPEHLPADELVNADLDFHLLVVYATHNSVLMKVFGTVFPLLGESRAKVHDVPGARRIIVTFHREIFNAFEQWDGAMADKDMTEHLEELWHEATEQPARPLAT